MKSNAPKFKGTMLMMNQGGPAPGGPRPAAGGAPPPAAAPPSASAPPSKIGSGAPPAGAAPGVPSRLKGTIVGVAPPTAGGAPAPAPGTALFDAPPPPPGFGAPPPYEPAAAPPPGDHHQFGSAQAANPLGATVAFDGNTPPFHDVPGAPAPAYGAPVGGAPGFGAPSANGGGFGAPPAGDPFGAPPQQPFAGGGFRAAAAAPGGNPYGAPLQPGFGAPPGGQPGFDPMNPGGAMHPYGGGAPMAAPGMPGAMVAGGTQKSWMTTLLLAVFAGTFGVHRFYTGHTLFGVLQLVTCGGGGIWTLIDIIFIVTGKYTDAQGRPLAKQ